MKLLLAFTLLFPGYAAAQEFSAGVWFGAFVSPSGEPQDERFEVEARGSDLVIFLAPYGRTPVNWGRVSLAAGSIAFRWASTTPMPCTLTRDARGEYVGTCAGQGQVAQRLTMTQTEPPHGLDLEVSRTDFQILARARQILSHPVLWNRRDERACEDDASRNSWSLFCAFYQASLDVARVYVHRRPVTTEVRAVVAAVTEGQRFEHLMRDYNNLASTSFEDILAVFDRTQRSLEARTPKPRE